MTLTIVVLVITAMTLTSARGTSQKEKLLSNSNSIPDSVYNIFMNSCVYCHSDGGKMLANAHVNFPDWDKYSQREKASKANKICEMISKGKMPPKSTRKSKPETVPTDEQIKSICSWASTIK